MQLTAPSPLLLNKGQPSSPCYCHTACNLQGSQMGTRLCPAPGQHPRGTSQPHRQAAGMHRHTGSWAEHMAVPRGCARHTDLGNFFLQGMNSGKGQGLLCTGGKAAATSVQLPAGDTLGDSGEFPTAALFPAGQVGTVILAALCFIHRDLSFSEKAMSYTVL